MPSELMDQRRQPSFCSSLPTSSFFSEEFCFPAQRQIGFWKTESVPDHQGVDGCTVASISKSVSSSPIEKFQLMEPNSMEHLELRQPYLFKDQKSNLNPEHQSWGTERNPSLQMTSWRGPGQNSGSQANLFAESASLFLEGKKVDLNAALYENALFSSSLSEIFDKKVRLSTTNVPYGQSPQAANSNFEEDGPIESLEEIEAQTIGKLLPDDDDLLSGLIDDLDYIPRLNGDDFEDDLFCSGGGMELEADDTLNSNRISNSVDVGASNIQLGDGPFVGKHPFGEHPSRTLFVRNINSGVEDAELRALFEQYGHIRTLYTACKHRGFVMISYYDIRSARDAMKALQNKPLRRRKLDIHYSIPKDNPSEKDINQGTLVVFNLDSSVSNDDLRQIFGAYGEVKEIHEASHEHQHKLIEFYDVRAAEAAHHALDQSDIAGKRIKLEPSRPGGARLWYPEVEQEESCGWGRGSPPNSSQLASIGSVPVGNVSSNGPRNGGIQGPHFNPHLVTSFHGISSSLPQSLSSPIRVATVSNHPNQPAHGDLSHSLEQANFGCQGTPSFNPHSLPDYHDGIVTGIPYNSSSTIPAMAINVATAGVHGSDNRNIRANSSGLGSLSHEHGEGVFGVSAPGNCPLHGNQLVWSNSNSYHNPPPRHMIWPNSPSFLSSVSAHPPTQVHGLARSPSHVLNNVMPYHHHHHVGSAPAVNPSLWDRRLAFSGDPPESSAFHPGSRGNMRFLSSSPMHPLELASHNLFPHANGNCIDPSFPSAHVGLPSPQHRCQVFHGRSPMIPIPGSYDAPIRNRRSEASVGQAENKKQFELDVDRIIRGEDSRTTLMIKNIPNKYTSKMLLAAIDEHHRGTYDFIYLPIDFKNKCNVGYAFINMIDPQHIIAFYQTFNGKKWEKFNSEKVASLAYARIQGKSALIAHFQNSSLMNEDKRCRPILFHSDGPNAGDQEPFPMGANIRSRPGRSRSASNEESHQQSPSTSPNREGSFNITDSSGGPTEEGLEGH